VTVDRAAIVEAGARAVYAVAGPSKPFDEQRDTDQDAWRAEAEAAYDAMVGLIRQADAKRIEDLEAEADRREERAWNDGWHTASVTIAEQIESEPAPKALANITWSTGRRYGIAEAVKIARRVGGPPRTETAHRGTQRPRRAISGTETRKRVGETVGTAEGDVEGERETGECEVDLAAIARLWDATMCGARHRNFHWLMSRAALDEIARLNKVKLQPDQKWRPADEPPPPIEVRMFGLPVVIDDTVIGVKLIDEREAARATGGIVKPGSYYVVQDGPPPLVIPPGKKPCEADECTRWTTLSCVRCMRSLCQMHGAINLKTMIHSCGLACRIEDVAGGGK